MTYRTVIKLLSQSQAAIVPPSVGKQNSLAATVKISFFIIYGAKNNPGTICFDGRSHELNYSTDRRCDAYEKFRAAAWKWQNVVLLIQRRTESADGRISMCIVHIS